MQVHGMNRRPKTTSQSCFYRNKAGAPPTSEGRGRRTERPVRDRRHSRPRARHGARPRAALRPRQPARPPGAGRAAAPPRPSPGPRVPAVQRRGGLRPRQRRLLARAAGHRHRRERRERGGGPRGGPGGERGPGGGERAEWLPGVPGPGGRRPGPEQGAAAGAGPPQRALPRAQPADAVHRGVPDTLRLVLPVHRQGAHGLDRGRPVDRRGAPLAPWLPGSMTAFCSCGPCELLKAGVTGGRLRAGGNAS